MTALLRNTSVSLAALLVLPVGCASSTLTAEQIVLTDPSGTPRVFLGTTEAGTGLVIMDERGKIRAGLNLVRDSSELSLSDAAGTIRVVLAHKGERSTLTLVAGEGGARATVLVEEAGGKLSLADREGKVTFSQ